MLLFNSLAKKQVSYKKVKDLKALIKINSTNLLRVSAKSGTTPDISLTILSRTIKFESQRTVDLPLNILM